MHRKSEVPALHALPPTLLRQTFERLTAGQKVATVARWLMTQDRGELQHQGFYEIRKEVAHLKGRIDRNEDVSVDPEPPARQIQAVSSAYEVHLQKLQKMAMADRLTGREVLNFLLCVELELLRELQQKGGTIVQLTTVLGHLRHIGQDLCKLGPGLNAWCEVYPRLDIDGKPIDPEQEPKPPDAETLRRRKQVEEMEQSDRMLGLSVFGLAEEIVRLKTKMGLVEPLDDEPADKPEGEPQP